MSDADKVVIYEAQCYHTADQPESHSWWMPAYQCRKCEHYQKGKRRGTPRYPCCKWRASENPEGEAVGDVLNAVQEARKFADDIIGC